MYVHVADLLGADDSVIESGKMLGTGGFWFTGCLLIGRFEHMQFLKQHI